MGIFFCCLYTTDDKTLHFINSNKQPVSERLFFIVNFIYVSSFGLPFWFTASSSFKTLKKHSKAVDFELMTSKLSWHQNPRLILSEKLRKYTQIERNFIHLRKNGAKSIVIENLSASILIWCKQITVFWIRLREANIPNEPPYIHWSRHILKTKYW